MNLIICFHFIIIILLKKLEEACNESSLNKHIIHHEHKITYNAFTCDSYLKQDTIFKPSISKGMYSNEYHIGKKESFILALPMSILAGKEISKKISKKVD